MIDSNLVIILVFIFMLVSLLSGLPICVGLALPGIIGTILIQGVPLTIQQGHLIWGQAYSWTMLAVPGFVLMGNLFLYHQFGADLYNATSKWLGRLPGSLVVVTVAMSALFGFMSGSLMAGIATISGIAIPELEKRHFDRRLSTGAICIAGSLAALIPPSVLMIMYATMAEVSLGALFIAGIIPGLAYAALVSLYVIARAKLNPELCPLAPPTPLKEKFSSSVGLIPVALAFIIVLGGIYMGIWTAIEAAAGGAVGAFLISIAYRRSTWLKLRGSLKATIKICAMVFAIMIGAALFNYFIFVSGFNDLLTSFIEGLALSEWMVVVIILILMTVMGFVLDVMALMMISIPIFLPIIESLGFDPIWFGVIMIIQVELALVTPPVGVNLYIIKSLLPEDVPMSDIIRGALPYVLVVWVLIALLVAFPEIALWLPTTMRR